MDKYTTVNVRQLDRKGKPWQARAKYKDVDGKWKEVSKMLPNAKGKKEANRMAKEWLDTLNAEAEKMPNASKAKTLDETFTEYLRFQLDTGVIEKSTYSNSIHSYKNDEFYTQLSDIEKEMKHYRDYFKGKINQKGVGADDE